MILIMGGFFFPLYTFACRFPSPTLSHFYPLTNKQDAINQYSAATSKSARARTNRTALSAASRCFAAVTQALVPPCPS